MFDFSLDSATKEHVSHKIFIPFFIVLLGLFSAYFSLDIFFKQG